MPTINPAARTAAAIDLRNENVDDRSTSRIGGSHETKKGNGAISSCSRWIRSHWRQFVIPVAFFAIWELSVRLSGIQSDSFAAPFDVLVAFVNLALDGSLAKATLRTFAAAGVGLLIGAVTGAASGIMLGLMPRTAAYFRSPIELLRPIPSVALIPLSLMSFGFGVAMEAAIIAFATFWPVLILSAAAVGSVDPRLLEVARVLRLGASARVFKIVLPASWPRLIVALRLAAGLSLVVAVTVEIAANPQGLGYALVVAQQALRPNEMLAILLWIGIIGWAVNAGLVYAERSLFQGIGLSVRSGEAA